MKKLNLIQVGLVAVALGISAGAFAEETVGEKAQHVGNKAADGVKETYRDAKDKTCEMVNGKMECVGKKISNKVKTGADKLDTKAKEMKNKAD